MTPRLKAIVEALLFAADEPLSLRRLASLLDEYPAGELRAVVRELEADYGTAGRGLQVAEIAGGYRLLTRPELAPWVARLLGRSGRPRLSQPALETLAIIAYKQPVTRAELEEIRGVNAEGVLRTLIERDLVTIVGRDEGLGRPLLYGTTDAFLTTFGLKSLGNLPRSDELEVFLAERESERPEGEGAQAPSPPPTSLGPEPGNAGVPASGPPGDAGEVPAGGEPADGAGG